MSGTGRRGAGGDPGVRTPATHADARHGEPDSVDGQVEPQLNEGGLINIVAIWAQIREARMTKCLPLNTTRASPSKRTMPDIVTVRK